jgi:hypothetical protein
MQKKFELPETIIHKRIHAVRPGPGRSGENISGRKPIYLSVKRTEFDRLPGRTRRGRRRAELRCRQAVSGYDPLTRAVAVLDRDTGDGYRAAGRW